MTRVMRSTLLLLLVGSNAIAADPLIADKNLDAAIKAALPHHKGDLTESALNGLYILDANDRGIDSLTGLERCPNLADVRLAKNRVADLKPLAGLKNLQSLTLDHNKIEGIAPLKELVALQFLEISDNQIADLAPLAKLTALSALYASGNKIAELAPLVELKKLSSLSLARNQIASLEPLAKLTRISVLDLSENRIEDIAPLAKLTDIALLMLAKNKVVELEPLVAACAADAAGPKRFAPFLRLYLAGNPLADATKGDRLAALRASGVRVEDVK